MYLNFIFFMVLGIHLTKNRIEKGKVKRRVFFLRSSWSQYMLSGCQWRTRFLSSNLRFLFFLYLLYLYLMKWTSIGKDTFSFDCRMLIVENTNRKNFVLYKEFFDEKTEGRCLKRIKKIAISSQTIYIYFIVGLYFYLQYLCRWKLFYKLTRQ